MPDTSENGKYITYENVGRRRHRTDPAQPARRPATRRTGDCWSSSTRPSNGPKRTTRCGWSSSGGVGPLFSSGHDMGSKESQAERAPGPDQHPSMTINGATRVGAENRMLQEWHYYFQNTLRWRNLRKITVAQVQGTVYAAGLMLMWACDLIVAADDVYFADVVGTRLGMCGVEYFGHPWEFGPRRTKELMLTGDAIDVHEAHRLGMVSKVFPVDDLSERTLAYARRIAQLPTMSALLIKESVNQTVDNMGFYNSLQACFTLHQLNHSHWAEIHESKYPVAEEQDGVPSWRVAPPVLLSVKDQVEGPVAGG